MHYNQRLGTVRVHVVSIDLQSKGFEVFQEDGLCSFDLVAHKDGDLIRVEVKGDLKHGGKIPRGNIVGATGQASKLDCRKFDELAVVSEAEQGFDVRYLHSQNTLSHRKETVAAYELAGIPERSPHTTKKNLKRAAEFYKESNDYQDKNGAS